MPAQSQSAQPDPAQPDPAQPDPAQPDPAQPGPAQPGPERPRSGEPSARPVAAQPVAGLDIGTTAVKALVVGEDGRVLGRSRVPSRLSVELDGRFEHDAAFTWWDAPRQALAEAVADAGSGHAPLAVAVSAMMPSVTATGTDGRPVGPGLLYSDSRGWGTPGEQVDPLANPEMSRLCAWVASADGAADGAAGRPGLWPAQAVANASLGGPGTVDLATAFACGPLFGGSGWDAAACAQVGVTPGQLPGVALFGEALGEVAAPWGTSMVLGAGSVDGFCEQLVSGAAEDGDVLVCLGSTLLVWLTAPGWPDEVPGLWRVPHLVGGKAMVGGASNAGGLWTGWARRLFGQGEGPGPSPGNVPIWYPWARGERVPFHDPTLRVSLAGASVADSPAALLRAAYEASAFVARQVCERAAACASNPGRYIASGGGVRDRAWLQALADVLGQPVTPVGMPESAALGAAWLARMALGLEASLDEARRWVTWSEPVQPDPLWVAATDERYRRWCEGLPRQAAL